MISFNEFTGLVQFVIVAGFLESEDASPCGRLTPVSVNKTLLLRRGRAGAFASKTPS